MPREVQMAQTFLGTPEEVFQLLFGEAFTIEYQMTQGNKQVEIAPWTPDAAVPGTQVRTVKYSVPLKIPLPTLIASTTGLKDTTVTTRERVEHQGANIVVTSECEVKGPPLVKHTKVEPKFVLKPGKGGKGSELELLIAFQYTYMMGVNGMVESTMDNGVRKGFEEWMNLGVQKDKELHGKK
jgi:hypothetical protein